MARTRNDRFLIGGDKIHTFHTQKIKHGFVLSDSGKDLSSFAGKINDPLPNDIERKQ